MANPTYCSRRHAEDFLGETTSAERRGDMNETEKDCELFMVRVYAHWAYLPVDHVVPSSLPYSKTSMSVDKGFSLATGATLLTLLATWAPEADVASARQFVSRLLSLCACHKCKRVTRFYCLFSKIGE